MLGADWRGYGIAVLDYTDPKKAASTVPSTPNKEQNPASVGKIAIMLGWFQEL